MIGDSRIGCKSDADEQLIIHFEFTEFVKVSFVVTVAVVVSGSGGSVVASFSYRQGLRRILQGNDRPREQTM